MLSETHCAGLVCRQHCWLNPLLTHPAAASHQAVPAGPEVSPQLVQQGGARGAGWASGCSGCSAAAAIACSDCRRRRQQHKRHGKQLGNAPLSLCLTVTLDGHRCLAVCLWHPRVACASLAGPAT